jgi:RNA polymerase sigma-70 factor, ECF subfamily
VQAPDPAESWDWSAARARCLREARRIVGSERDAEDAVQEALIRAWRNRSSCRTPRAPLPWLLQITRREALRINERARPVTLLEREEANALPDEAPGEDEALARLDVGRVLATLPPTDRALLALRYERDLTQPRVAEVLALPEGTVKVRLHRLRSRLREALEPGE